MAGVSFVCRRAARTKHSDRRLVDARVEALRHWRPGRRDSDEDGAGSADMYQSTWSGILDQDAAKLIPDPRIAVSCRCTQKRAGRDMHVDEAPLRDWRCGQAMTAPAYRRGT